LKTFSTICMAIYLACIGCTEQIEAKPDGRSLVTNDLTSRGSGAFKVVEVKKHDGQSSEVFGVKKYTLDFIATVEFLEDSIYRQNGKIEVKRAIDGVAPGINEILAKKGSRAITAGHLMMQRKESGWLPESIEYTGMTYDLDSMDVVEDKADYKKGFE
jgi:hypothetical protein